MSKVDKKKVNIPEFLKKDKSEKEIKELELKLNSGSLYGTMCSKLNKKVTPKRNWLNLASFLNNDYSKRYPELGVEFYVPNTHLLYDESEYEDLNRKEMIELMLSINGCYAVITWRENKYKLIDAKHAYDVCSEVLNINKGRKNSIRRSNKKDIKLLTALDVFERYKICGRFRKLKK